MISSSFSSAIFRDLAPLLPPDMLADAQYMKFDRREMVGSLIRLSAELQEALRRRGEFGRVVAVAHYFAPKIQGIAALLEKRQTPLEGKRGREEDAMEDAEEDGMNEMAVKRQNQQGSSFHAPAEMEETDSEPASSSSSSTTSETEVLEFLASPSLPSAQSSIPIDPVGESSVPPLLPIDEAACRLSSLLQHPSVHNALFRFKIDLSQLVAQCPPQGVIQKIEMKIRSLLRELPALRLPCLPGNLTAHPDVLADFFDEIYHTAILEVLQRLADAGSSTARAIAERVSSTASSQGLSQAIAYAFRAAQEHTTVIRNELPPQEAVSPFSLFNTLRFIPHYFVGVMM